MYGIEDYNKANKALGQVERAMWQQIRDLDDKDNIFSTDFKEAVILFIHEHKRLPKKDEFTTIRSGYVDPQPNSVDFTVDFNEEWKQEYGIEHWVMDNGDVIDNGNGYVAPLTTTTAVEVYGDASNFTDVDFSTYITMEAAVESALGSAKGINKYTLDHPGI